MGGAFHRHEGRLKHWKSTFSYSFWRHGVATWGPDAKKSQSRLFWVGDQVGSCGDLVKPSLDSRALISPLVPWIGVRLAVMLAACSSSRGWSRVGAENSKKGKFWQHGTHRKLHNSG